MLEMFVKNPHGEAPRRRSTTRIQHCLQFFLSGYDDERHSSHQGPDKEAGVTSRGGTFQVGDTFGEKNE